MTPALHGHHLVVLLEHDVFIRIEEEQCQVAVERRDAARGPNTWRLPHVMEEALHGGMIGGVDALDQREGALSTTLIGVVHLGVQDP